jgi:hypothetical protein
MALPLRLHFLCLATLLISGAASASPAQIGERIEHLSERARSATAQGNHPLAHRYRARMAALLAVVIVRYSGGDVTAAEPRAERVPNRPVATASAQSGAPHKAAPSFVQPVMQPTGDILSFLSALTPPKAGK